MNRPAVRAVFAIILALLVISCTSEQRERLSNALNSTNDEKGTKVIRSTDGCCSVTVPGSWKEEKELNAQANLQASNRLKELYIIVISESKEDFQEMTLERHSELTRTEFAKSLTTPEVSEAAFVTVNKNNGVQYQISGAINNVKIVAFHTTVETPKYFHQILAWTIKSRLEKNKPILQSVIESFKEDTSDRKSIPAPQRTDE
ncbi:MAG TPA: hypothetical protein VLH08_12315 [Acidobacteriota bacterium]|nr:hypothetical protein [Acidobacteriota bacterium]